jgi:hypothetical protein
MKIFCIGFNKTGTTSLRDFFHSEDFSSGDQQAFENNLNSYRFKNYSTFIEMIKQDFWGSNIFQDIPFSLPEFYKELYKEFPNAYYILTIRDNDEEWYNSLINWNLELFGQTHKPYDSFYIHRGWVISLLTDCYGTPKYDPYNKEILIQAYNKHNQEVKEFFKNKPNFIELNLVQEKDTSRLSKFLGVKFKNQTFPHSNKTQK